MNSIRYLLNVRNRLEDNVRSPRGKTPGASGSSEEISPGDYLRDVLGFNLFGKRRDMRNADLSVKFDDKYKPFEGKKYERQTKSNLVNTGSMGLFFEDNRSPNTIDASWINNYDMSLENPLLPFVAVGLFLSPVITIPTIFAEDSLERVIDWYSKTFEIETAR